MDAATWGLSRDHYMNAFETGTTQAKVRIIAREKDEVNTRIREAIFIKKTCPDLNTKEEADLVDLVT